VADPRDDSRLVRKQGAPAWNCGGRPRGEVFQEVKFTTAVTS
jgi:hypothetical protein